MPAGKLHDYKLTSTTIQINTAFVILAVRPEQFDPELTAKGLTVEGLVQNQILDAPSPPVGGSGLPE